MLDGWDGQLTPALRRQVYRHIERCATCTTRRGYELRPEVLLGLSPGVAMAAAAAESFQLAAGVPAGLREHTLELAAGQDPGGAAHRAAAAGRAGTFGRDGFPEPLHAGGAKTGLRSSRWAQAAVAAAVVVAVGVTAGAFALTGGTSTMALAGGKTQAAVPVPAPSTDPSRTSAEPSGATSKKPPTHPHSHATTPPATRAAAPTTPASPQGTTSPPTQPAASVSVLGPGGAVLTPGSQLTIQGNGTSITLKANGGTVNWSVTVSGHRVFVLGPSSGTLSAGETTSVYIAAFGHASQATLTVSPGGASYSLMFSSRR
jgi:hypothetical protein